MTGKYRRGEASPSGTRLAGMNEEMSARVLSDRNFDQLDFLEGFASAREHSLLDLAFAWLAAQPAMGSIIAGATKVEQVRANAAAADWKLTDAEVAEVTAGLEEIRLAAKSES